MNIKRAIWVGIAVYLVSFFIGLIVMTLAGINPADTSEIPNSILYVNIFITIIIAALFTILYLKDKKIEANAKEGLFFGLVLIVIGFVFDIVIFAIASATTANKQSLIDYYSNPVFWAALILFLATTTITAANIKRKK